MSESRAAYRYALALAELAEEVGQFPKVTDDVEYLTSLIGQSRDFVLFLRSPVVNKGTKKQLITAMLEGKVSELTFKFLKLLAAKGRESLLPEITKAFSKIRDRRMGVLNATVRSAVSFTPEQRQQLVDQLRRATKKEIRLHDVRDATVIGGMMVQFEDTVWDGSIRCQLEHLRRQFVKSTK